MGKLLFLAAVMLVVVLSKDPPVWQSSFSQRFVATFHNKENQTFHSVGDHFYDYANKRSRMDYRDGSWDFLCNTVVNESTPCTFLTIGGKRYLVFPEKKIGCFCCDSAHGCGVLRPDWLNQATYIGTETLLGQDFDKWSKPDGGIMDYYWATTDSKQIPRRVDQGGSREYDYLMNTYSTDPIRESVFELPSYVSGDCPATSNCGMFRLTEQ